MCDHVDDSADGVSHLTYLIHEVDCCIKWTNKGGEKDVGDMI